jgi:four helix bundle protein
MGQNAIKEKSFSFALKVMKAHQYLNQQKREFVISRQFLRSGTAIGALVREAEQAESKADFVHKLSIALKEASETRYWIDLLHQSNYLDPAMHKSLDAELHEMLKLLTSIIKTSKSRK